MTYTISFTNKPTEHEIETLSNGLEKHAIQTIGKKSFEPFSFLIHDQEQKLIAGCTGVLMYGFLHIKLIWVDEDIRGKGLGAKLIKKSEEFAREKNCRCIIVETFDWQGKGFYEKLGYESVFSHEGFDDDYVFHYYKKRCSNR